MPVLVKDYTWEQAESQVFITVPLKGVVAGKADIFCAEDYLKVRGGTLKETAGGR